MDTMSYIIGRNSAGGGGTATTPSWSEVTNKPFETIGTGLTVTAGALEATGEATVDWSDVQNKPEFATVATSGDYDDLSNKPTIPQPTSVTVTQTLQSGTAIADIDVDGVTTTLYAPSGGSGASTWSEITSKPFSTVDTTTGLTIVNDTLMLETLDHVATIDYVDNQINSVTTTMEDDYAQKSDLATVATTGSYNDLEDKLEFWSGDGISLNQDENIENAYQFQIDEYDIGFQGKIETAAYEAGYRKPNDISYNDIQDKPSDVSEFYNDAGYITDSALIPYVESSDLASVATSGDYDDLINKPTIPAATSVTVTQTLSSGTAIADIDVDGVTTTLYAPAGGTAPTPNWTATSGQDGFILNKPRVYSGTFTDYRKGIILCDTSNQCTGVFAVAEGTDNTASGGTAHAEGSNNTASGAQSHAEGKYTTASSSYAHAEGFYSTASAFGSHAEGQNTTASSSCQHAQGKYNIADSNNLYADIVGNGDSHTHSNAEATDWSGNKFLAGDVYTNVTDWTDPINHSTKLVSGSIVGITNTLSTGTSIADIDIDGVTTTLYAPAGGSGGSTAWADITGKPNINSGTGTSSIIMGDTCVASMSYGVAQGRNTTAKSWAHAEGYDTLADTSYSHAEGERTEARGTASHTEGHYSVAYGNYSHAEGHETITGSIYQHAQGKYNIRDNDSQYADIVGNGTLSHRNNAEATDWNGNKYLAGNIYLGVTNWATPTIGGTVAKIPKEVDFNYARGHNGVYDINGYYTEAEDALANQGYDSQGNPEFLGIHADYSFHYTETVDNGNMYWWSVDSADAVQNPDYNPDGGDEPDPEEPDPSEVPDEGEL